MIKNSICCDENLTFYFNKKNEYGNFPIFKCKKCNSGYVFPYPDDEILLDYYKNQIYRNQDYKNIFNEERIFPNSSIDAKRIIKNLLEFKNDNKKNLLDIGCGYGWICKEGVENGFNVIATELNYNCRNITTQMSGVEPLDRLIDHSFCKEYENKFDFIVLSQVLEHIKLDEFFLTNLIKLLKNDGIIVIAVPNFGSFLSILQGKNDMFLTPPEHINYFTLKGLYKIFKKKNLDLINFETISRYNKIKFLKKNKFLKFFFPLLDFFFYCSDKFNKGMFINIYLRK